ncbi:MAG TPA: hypothetical protein VK990_08780 [Acidimicrobiia bacterium]|nr:hypothetical protein [Acidimicrobiia bacterium]
MTWVLVASGVALGVDWRRLSLLVLVLIAPLPVACLVAVHWWRARPGLSLRAARFCEAVSGELRAGASLRDGLEKAALSVEAETLARACRDGAPMEEIASVAGTEFSEIGPELAALLARADGVGVSPAALFDEIGDLALAQVEVAHEVSAASAPARATGAVLLLFPLLVVGWALTRGDLEPYLRHPAQRAAVLTGLGLVVSGLISSVLILRRAR